MVTPLQLLKAVNSLAYRRRLEDHIPELEKTIVDYLTENETDQIRIGGYQVLREDDAIDIYKVPPVDADQLGLPL